MTSLILRFMRRLPLLTALLLLALAARPAAAETYQIRATADPARVSYQTDNPNRVTLRVSAFDSGGQPVPNSTIVYFKTSLGSMPAQAYTQNGQVTVYLENYDGPGRATIEISLGGSREIVNVDFLGTGAVATAAPTQRISYRVKARQCYYSPEQQVFDLREDAHFVAPTFSVDAESMQFGVGSKILTAQHNVTVTVGDRSFTAEKLWLNFASKSGAMVEIGDEIRYRMIRFPQIEPADDGRARTIDFTPLDPLPTKTWIICRQATIFPGEQIQFRQPKFYLDRIDKPLMSLPYHVLDLRSSAESTFFNTDISLASDAGLSIDFPFYYAANDSHVGSLHLRNVTQGSQFYRGKAGLQLSLEEEYLLGDVADGAVYFDDVTQSTRSVTWEHRHDFGAARLTAGAGYERTSDTAPYTSRANLSFYRPLGNVGMNLSTNWSRFNGGNNLYADLSVFPPAWALWRTRFSVAVDPYLRWSESSRASSQNIVTQKSTFAQGVRASLGFPELGFLGGDVSPYLSEELMHDSDGKLSNFFDAGVRYSRHLFGSFNSSLGYSYGLSTSNRDTVRQLPDERLTLDVNGGGEDWNTFAYSSYNLRSQTLNTSLNVRYLMPWDALPSGVKRWFFEYSTNYNTGLSMLTTADHLFTVGRSLGVYSLLLHYSPSGNNAVTGFGTGTGKVWAFELVRQGW